MEGSRGGRGGNKEAKERRKTGNEENRKMKFWFLLFMYSLPSFHLYTQKVVTFSTCCVFVCLFVVCLLVLIFRGTLLFYHAHF